jgi:putative transposase
MARLARVVAAGIPHHVTQRGNARRFILDKDADRLVYLNLLQQNLALHRISLFGYCVMSNHVHLVVIPHQSESLAPALREAHGRYAAYWNAVHQSSGHAWQGRYYSCPLNWSHLWEALRYTELNPVRAGLVAKSETWPWSSAGMHCGAGREDSFLDLDLWQSHWTTSEWRQYLGAGDAEGTLAELRQCTHTGRPLGSPEFVQALEGILQRTLAPRKGGRPPKKTSDARQRELDF